MQKFPHKLPYGTRVLRTRPDLTLEQEAKACGRTEAKIAAAWQDLERARTWPDFKAACDRYIKLASMTIAKAAQKLGIRSPRHTKWAHSKINKKFKHRGRWRVWCGDVQALLPRYDEPGGKLL